MFKSILVFALAIGIFAALTACAGQSFTQSARVPADPAPVVVNEALDSGDDRGWVQVIPPADLSKVQERAEMRKAHVARERARVQAVIDYIRTHNRFPPRTQPFDAAQQVVMDFIRINQRVPSSADQVNAPVQAVLDYIRIHHAMPPRTDPLDPAVQEVMDYIRLYNRVPTSAIALQ
jgi:hypothetical protein